MMQEEVTSTTIIDTRWPTDGLEVAGCCPYCFSERRRVAHEDVQDWSFYCAPGKWTYWGCDSCGSLYLSPRPTPGTIGRAYKSYYTHRDARAPLRHRLRNRLKNEYWSVSLRGDFRPRLHLPRALHWVIRRLKSRLTDPFALKELAGLPKGRLMDVGCGDGFMLEMARALGWRAVGLEVDSAAVQASRSRGLEVVEGSVSCLGEYLGEFDCIICSHVLEHVHEPSTLLLNLHKALKVGGVLLLSSPNAGSQVRRHFGNDWRGLEAPRHLSIPSLQQLEIMLVGLGFSVRQVLERPVATGIESARIRRRGLHISPQDTATARSMAAGLTTASREQYDFLELVCVKNDRPEPSLK